ncbi:hypothetical protein DM860_007156 [Cuscuta australis]|uniref:arginine--tRNA ligase n=1 Tax=Cuscuta australis TaxID=267555 RepID=A0A328E638_9ASTE|nr:hypothetical protein DM860_007156 [Cuscuta australis]
MEGEILLQAEDECMLGMHLLQFVEVVEEACTNLLPHVVCEYLYVLSMKFTSFYSKCKNLVGLLRRPADCFVAG